MHAACHVVTYGSAWLITLGSRSWVLLLLAATQILSAGGGWAEFLRAYPSSIGDLDRIWDLR